MEPIQSLLEPWRQPHCGCAKAANLESFGPIPHYGIERTRALILLNTHTTHSLTKVSGLLSKSQRPKAEGELIDTSTRSEILYSSSIMVNPLII